MVACSCLSFTSNKLRVPFISTSAPAPLSVDSLGFAATYQPYGIGCFRRPSVSSFYQGFYRMALMQGSTEKNTLNVSSHHELQDVADFEIIASNGLISICGFGSLLSEKSARATFPNLQNFRTAILHDFRRVFAHAAPIFFERGIANTKTKEISSLSVEPCPGESIIVTVFEISISNVAAFIEREHEFRFLSVLPMSLEGKLFSQKAVICSRYSDEEYRNIRCQGSDEEYHKRYGRHGIETIWRDDILPCRLYLRHCVLAARNLGETAYNSFMDHTYLGDRRTTVREHLANNPDIMEEKPPYNLHGRYSG